VKCNHGAEMPQLFRDDGIAVKLFAISELQGNVLFVFDLWGDSPYWGVRRFGTMVRRPCPFLSPALPFSSKIILCH